MLKDFSRAYIKQSSEEGRIGGELGLIGGRTSSKVRLIDK